MIKKILWHNIETVLLDMDGTLLDLHFDSYFWRTYLPKIYAQQYNIPISQAQKKLYNDYRSHEQTLNWYSTDYWSQYLQIPIVEHLHHCRHKIQPRLDALTFLNQLKQSPYHCHIVTNADWSSINLKCQLVPLKKIISSIISSHDFKQPKESPLFWDALQKKHPFNPKYTLFIDDNQHVLSTAKNFGIQHLYTIDQPDLSQKKIIQSSYPSISSFSEIYP